METIVVIGSGHMGVGIAAIFLASGHDVVVLGRQLPAVEARLPAMRALAATLSAHSRFGE